MRLFSTLIKRTKSSPHGQNRAVNPSIWFDFAHHKSVGIDPERRRRVKDYGEETAARFLSRKGYVIVGRNIKTFVGEIDIVAQKSSTIVFVEVKARKSSSLGPPYISITGKKKKKLIQCALCYLKMKHIYSISWQIDVVSVEFHKDGFHVKKLEHFENAVEE